MNEPLYECQDPTGYYDQAEAWLDPGSIAVRWKFAQDLAAGRSRASGSRTSFYAGLPRTSARGGVAGRLVERILPGGISARTSEFLRPLDRAAARGAAGRLIREELAPFVVGIVLGSPEFQKQ